MYLSDEKILENWKLFVNFSQKMGDKRKDKIKIFLDENEERLSLTPASTRKAYHAAYPGGLVDHSLRVLKIAKNLTEAVGLYNGLNAESIIFSCLFHDIGKLGEGGKNGLDYYIPESSTWHRDNLGQYYKINDKLNYMKNSLRGIYLLQQYGIPLTEDEFLAIYLNDGWIEEQNKPYCLKEPALVTLVQQADYLATKEEKKFKY